MLLIQRKNLLVLDDWTALFLSPVTEGCRRIPRKIRRCFDYNIIIQRNSSTVEESKIIPKMILHVCRAVCFESPLEGL